MTNAQKTTPELKKRWWRTPWGRIFLAGLSLYLGMVAGMLFLERRLIFFPSTRGDWQPAGLNFEDVQFSAADGTRLHGWYLPHPQPRAVLLYVHGNAGNLSDRRPMVVWLQNEFDVAVMIFDYRGYGRSEGTPDEPGILADTRAARAWTAKRAGIPEKDVVLVGESLGGAVAVDLAARDGARGLILLNTFTSLPDVAAHHYPWLPVRWLMRTRLDGASKIGDYHGPLLQCHSQDDEIIPYALGKRLFELAGSAHKKLVTFTGRSHNDSPRTPEFTVALEEFFAQLPAMDSTSSEPVPATEPDRQPEKGG